MPPAVTNAATARQSKPIAAKPLDRGYLNGNSVDGKTIETLARASDVIEPEPLEADERFESRDKTKPKARFAARAADQSTPVR